MHFSYQTGQCFQVFSCCWSLHPICPKRLHGPVLQELHCHDHDLLCQRCQDLKDVLSDINMAIQNRISLKMSMTKKMLFTPFKRPSERFISGSRTSCDLWIKMPHVLISSIVSTRIASYLSKTGPWSSCRGSTGNHKVNGLRRKGFLGTSLWQSERRRVRWRRKPLCT